MTDFDDPLIGNDPTVGNGDHIERPARSTSPLEGGLMDLVTYYGSFVPTLRPEQTMKLPTIDDATALAREVLELRDWHQKAATAMRGQQEWQRQAIKQMESLVALIERLKPQSEAERWAEMAQRNHDLVLAAFRSPAPPALGGDNGD